MDHRKPMDAPDAAAMAIGSKFVWQQPGEVGGFPIGVGHPPVGIPIKRISRYFRDDPVDMYTPCFNLSTYGPHLVRELVSVCGYPRTKARFVLKYFSNLTSTWLSPCCIKAQIWKLSNVVGIPQSVRRVKTADPTCWCFETQTWPALHPQTSEVLDFDPCKILRSGPIPPSWWFLYNNRNFHWVVSHPMRLPTSSNYSNHH